MRYKLNIEKEFTDKYTNEKYKIGDVIEADKQRGEELLSDKRQLVTLNKVIELPPKDDNELPPTDTTITSDDNDNGDSDGNTDETVDSTTPTELPPKDDKKKKNK